MQSPLAGSQLGNENMSITLCSTMLTRFRAFVSGESCLKAIAERFTSWDIKRQTALLCLRSWSREALTCHSACIEINHATLVTANLHNKRIIYSLRSLSGYSTSWRASPSYNLCDFKAKRFPGYIADLSPIMCTLNFV